MRGRKSISVTQKSFNTSTSFLITKYKLFKLLTGKIAAGTSSENQLSFFGISWFIFRLFWADAKRTPLIPRTYISRYCNAFFGIINIDPTEGSYYVRKYVLKALK